MRRKRKISLLPILAFVGLSIIVAAACTSGKVVAEQRVVEATPPANSVAGSYLAGRFAQRQKDWATAQEYMSGVLSVDETNKAMLLRTFLLSLGSGRYDRALPLAEKLRDAKDDNEIALIFLACDALKKGNYAAAYNDIQKLPASGFGQYTRPLLSVWALAGMGKKDEALAKLAAATSEADPTYRIHAALLEELSGNNAGATLHYTAALKNGIELHAAFMAANFFAHTGHPEIAQTLYASLRKNNPLSPLPEESAKNAAANITSPADGAALAMLDLASILHAKRAEDSAQIYASIALMLSPQSPFALLITGDIAALNGRYDTALAQYAQIGAATPVYWVAKARMAEVNELAGRVDESARVLETMANAEPVKLQALVALGDLYRRNEDFNHAITAYDRAMDVAGEAKADHWAIIYARGVAKERSQGWDAAEKDLMQALSFQPQNPMVLNFIAYSWAEKGVNLDKALAYAKQAVDLSPNDGYILDSYGWTLLRLSRVEESIVWLERAAEQKPNDSTIVDHLGDAYYLAGRVDEARDQWRHAGGLSRDPAFKRVVDEKLRNGISNAPRQQAKL